VHSHTRLSVYMDCRRYEICAFATFVLPDSECPGRINSYEFRCPKNQQEFNKAFYEVNTTMAAHTLEAALDDMQKEKHITFAQCKENYSKTKPKNRRFAPVGFLKSVRRDLTVRDVNTGLALY